MKNLYLLYGGKSTEHEISVLTAKSVINNLDGITWEKILRILKMKKS